MSDKSFYSDKILKKIKLDSNGLSFISSIRLFFAKFLKVYMTIEKLFRKIYDFFMLNKINCIEQNENYSKCLKNQLTSLFND